MHPDRIRHALVNANLPVPSGILLDAAFRMRTGDWYVRTDAGWLWWDKSLRTWMPLPYGPL